MTIRTHAVYRLLDTPAPDAAREGCYLTGVSGPCVDTGALIYQEGTLTISVSAIRELAEVAGMSVNEEGLATEAENAHLHARIATLEIQLAEEREHLDVVGLLLARAQPPGKLGGIGEQAIVSHTSETIVSS